MGSEQNHTWNHPSAVGDEPERSGMTAAIGRSEARELGQSLSRLLHSSEPAFLDFGETLMAVWKMTKTISSEAMDTAALFSEDNVGGHMAEFQALLECIDGLLKQECEMLDQDVDALFLSKSQVQTIRDIVDTFKRHVKELRMLAVSIRIEDARLQETSRLFTTLAEDVSRLADETGDRVKAVQEKLLGLDRILDESIPLLKQTQKMEIENTQGVLQTLNQCMSLFQDLQQQSRGMTDRISRDSGSLSRDISDVVAAMQFHDITRQKTEHVIEALDLAAEKMEGVNGAFSGIPVDTGALDAGTDFQRLYRLQALQLESALQEMDEAVHTVLARMADIGGKTADLSQQTRNLYQTASRKTLSCESDIDEHVHHILQSLAGNAENADLARTLLEPVERTLQEAAAFVQDIETIGEEIDLIAKNGMIKAARLGSDGAALGVLADAIVRLSARAGTGVDALASALSDLGEKAGLITAHQETCAVQNGSDASSDSLMEQLESCLGALKPLMKQIFRQIESIDGQSSRLNSLIEASTAGFRIHETYASVIQPVIVRLKQAAGTGQDTAGDTNIDESWMQDLHNRYTMHSERENFETVVQGAGCSAAPGSEWDRKEDDNIELF